MHARSSGDELADPESTCCHRATWCVPGWRKLNVDEAVAGCGCCDFTYATGFWLVTVLAILGLLYALLYLYVGEAMLPGGPYFGLYLVVCSSYFAGWALAYVPRVQLPPVFGMILAGILVRNLHWYNIEEALSMATTAKIRMFTATFVMLRAGLQLNTTTLRDHPRFIVLLALVPCTMEMCAVAVCARSLLDLPWGWAFLLGSITACLSPVIPINTMLALAEEGYGEDKHMASLLLTAASIDDVHIVSVYAICFSFVFNHDEDQGGSYWWSIFPNEIKDLLLGTTFGAALGIFFVFFPHRKHKYVAWYRICGLVLGSLVCVASTYKVTITGSGYLATIVMSLIATSGWRVLSRPFDLQPLRQAVHIMWHLMQPVLCGVMGAEVDLSGWSLGRLGLYVICLACGLAVRSAFVFLSTWRSPFNKKERAFIALVWLAKGATQAALAPMVLEEALSTGGGEQQRRMGYVLDVVRMAVVTVLLMSPIPAVAIMIAGPRLLHRLDEEERSKQRELSLIRLLSLQPVRKRRH